MRQGADSCGIIRIQDIICIISFTKKPLEEFGLIVSAGLFANDAYRNAGDSWRHHVSGRSMEWKDSDGRIWSVDKGSVRKPTLQEIADKCPQNIFDEATLLMQRFNNPGNISLSVRATENMLLSGALDGIGDPFEV